MITKRKGRGKNPFKNGFLKLFIYGGLIRFAKRARINQLFFPLFFYCLYLPSHFLQNHQIKLVKYFIFYC